MGRKLMGYALKGKVVLVALVSLAVIGGATAMAASTSTGTNPVKTLSGPSQAGSSNASSHATSRATGSTATCPGLPDIQRLAAQFSLSTTSADDDMLALCALHQGTFTGTTPAGTSLSSTRVFGYGEIGDLLTYAQYLAAHNSANVGGKLTTANARSYLALALHTCGARAIETCLKTHIPGFQPGNPNSGNGQGKPSSTPGHGKPASTPTPPRGKPTSTPTPHR